VRRVCFTLQVKPELLEEYRRRHAHVWPDMLAALAGAGWNEYQLFLRDDGLLVGTLLTDDLAAAQAAMDATEVSARWEAQMAEFFIHGRHLVVLDEVFNLEHQLGASQ
jgi:L-rhamnose mutarotase